jgi:hypothetical protein
MSMVTIVRLGLEGGGNHQGLEIIRTPGPLSPQHPSGAIQEVDCSGSAYGENAGKWKSGNPEIRKIGNSKIRKSGNP